MSALPNVGLQPAARPVDTFAPSEVRMGSGGNDAKTLGQLAAALSEFNGSLQTVAGQYINSQNEIAHRTGEADAARYQNMEAFKAAVDAGQIKETDNPWYMIGLKQTMDEIRTRGAVNQWRAWLQNSPDAAGLRSSDNPDDIDKAFDSMVGPILRTMDSHSVNRVLPELQQAKQSIILNHLSERSQERKAEMDQALTVGTRSDASAIATAADTVGPPAETRDDTITRTAGMVQARLDHALLTMNKLDAMKAVAAGVMEQGVGTADPELARSILSKVSVDGTTLAQTYEAELDHHEEAVVNLQVHRMDRQIHLDNEKLKLLEDNAVSAGSSVKPDDWAGYIQSLDPRLRVTIANKLAEYGGNLQHISELSARTNLVQTLMEDPTLRPKNLGEKYALIKDPEHYFTVHSNPWADHTNPVVKTQIYDYLHNHANVMDYTYLRTLGLNGQVSENDYEQFMKFVPGLTDKNPLSKFETAIGHGDDIIKGLLIGGMVASGRMQFPDNPISAELELKMAQARLLYRQTAEDMVLQKGSTLDPAQLRDQLTALAESAATSSTGIPIAKLREMNDTETMSRKWDEFRKSGAYADPSQLAPGSKDPTKFRMAGYNIESRLDGLPRVFASAQEYEQAKADPDSWARSKGLVLPTDKGARKDFFTNQSDLLIKAGLATPKRK
jgi:hypothetical protein